MKVNRFYVFLIGLIWGGYWMVFTIEYMGGRFSLIISLAMAIIMMGVTYLLILMGITIDKVKK